MALYQLQERLCTYVNNGGDFNQFIVKYEIVFIKTYPLTYLLEMMIEIDDKDDLSLIKHGIINTMFYDIEKQGPDNSVQLLTEIMDSLKIE